MRSISNTLALAALIAVFSVSAAGQSGAGAQKSTIADPAVSVGTITDSTYVNKYFGMRLAIPTGWNVYDAQGKKMVLEKGAQLLTSSNKKLQPQMDASMARTINVLTVSKLRQDQSGAGNAVLACGSELIPGTGMVTGKDYLNAMKQVRQGLKDIDLIPGDFGLETINGAEFAVLDLRSKLTVPTIIQKYYVIIKRGYALYLHHHVCE